MISPSLSWSLYACRRKLEGTGLISQLSQTITLLCLALLFLVLSCGTVRASENTGTLGNAGIQSAACAQLTDTLARIKCKGFIKVGVLTGFKGFSQIGSEGKFEGFEIDLAKRIADDLGVGVQFIPVSPALRIQPLVDGTVDLVIANLTDTQARRETIRFIRPHYFSSATVVMAPTEFVINNREDIRNLTVCVPLGNFSNILLVAAQARLLIYDKLESLMSALELGACQTVAHDRIVLQKHVSGPQAPAALRERFVEKISLSETPWGIAVSKSPESDSLEKTVATILVDLHASSFLLESAERWGIATPFLREEKRKWSSQTCQVANGVLSSACLLDPVASVHQPSAIAQPIRRFETWLDQKLGFDVRLPMFSTQIGLQLFIDGIITSLILALGGIGAVLLAAILFYQARITRIRPIQVPTKAVAAFTQYCPQLPLMVLAYFVVASFIPYSQEVALATAIVAIGLCGGAKAANAMYLIHYANHQLGMGEVVRHAAVSIRLSVIFAVKICPVAAFIGVPELLTVLNEITAFSGERFSTYLVVSVFYVVLILSVSKLSAVVIAKFGDIK